jgi:hypothetical protein
LAKQAEESPSAFMTLLGKALRMLVDCDCDDEAIKIQISVV